MKALNIRSGQKSLGKTNYYEILFVPFLIVVLSFNFLGNAWAGKTNTNTNVVVFTNVANVISWDLYSPYTNGFRELYPRDVLMFLPSNFLSELTKEIASTNFTSLIKQSREDSGKLKNFPEFVFAVCDATDWVGFSFSMDFPMSSSEQNEPSWVQRLRFYVRSRFDGHSRKYVTDAINEEAGGTNVTLPLGFPEAIEKRYWVPSEWIEEDSSELDKMEFPMPRQKGLFPLNRPWLVRDGKYAWVYYCFDGVLFSRRKDGKQYDPLYKEQFETAAREAYNRIKQSKTFSDSSIPLYNEVKSLLKKKFGIDWITPEELNIFRTSQ